MVVDRIEARVEQVIGEEAGDGLPQAAGPEGREGGGGGKERLGGDRLADTIGSRRRHGDTRQIVGRRQAGEPIV